VKDTEFVSDFDLNVLVIWIFEYPYACGLLVDVDLATGAIGP
jgi:hypothetical protein